ncbi:unnamed protein product [Trichogramma brassicae]|uniref:Uncharacterized protein n=1 Tax=Trichogramma brassicae TaxID=86971 RepID=A0A6H5IPQ1_9HYME|nr:unnamed protein product [Trichogramma brassicae]
MLHPQTCHYYCQTPPRDRCHIILYGDCLKMMSKDKIKNKETEKNVTVEGSDTIRDPLTMDPPVRVDDSFVHEYVEFYLLHQLEDELQPYLALALEHSAEVCTFGPGDYPEYEVIASYATLGCTWPFVYFCDRFASLLLLGHENFLVEWGLSPAQARLLMDVVHGRSTNDPCIVSEDLGPVPIFLLVVEQRPRRQ